MSDTDEKGGSGEDVVAGAEAVAETIDGIVPKKTESHGLDKVVTSLDKVETSISGVAGSISSIPADVTSVEGYVEHHHGLHWVDQIAKDVEPIANKVGPIAKEVQQVADVVKQVADAVRKDLPIAKKVLHEGLQFLGIEAKPSKPIARVRYHFSSQGDPHADWHVVRVHLREGLSSLYTCTLDLTTKELHTEPEALLGKSCELIIEREPLSRRVHGIVHRVEHSGTQGGQLVTRVYVVPALWALSQRVDSYIFQNQTVPEILDVVLCEGLQPFERSYDARLHRDYPRREYCVQYRETDLEFALRLMEDEGIAFYFDHSGDKEVLVLVDANETFQPCHTLDGHAVPVAVADSGTHHVETVQSFDWNHELQPNRVVVRDFDWTQPALDLTRKSPAQGGKSGEREIYLCPAPITMGGYDEDQHRYAEEDGGARAARWLEEHEARRWCGIGRGVVSGFMPGLTFELTGNARSEMDKRYLLTRVEHLGEASEELHSDAHARDTGTNQRYTNRFECIPADTVFRPERRTPRPRVHGIQTAQVVGPEGEEIWTDIHGRIKVQFHWDREGHRDERSSCWVRVMQGWGGAGWGISFLPRIGMEVVVSFLEGDPDRPLVTGCVYNGENPPPYPHAQERTRSTIKTHSSPGGDGFNELRFEDKAGKEEIFLHAQKDLNEVILHDHSTRVGRNQSLSVSGMRTKTVKKDEVTTIEGNRTETVKKDEDITIEGNRTETVKKDEDITIEGNRAETVKQDEDITIEGNRIETVKKDEVTTIEGNRIGTVKQNEVITIEGTRTETVDQFEMITLKNNRVVDITGTDTLKATSEIFLKCGDASIRLQSDGTIELNGTKTIVMSVASSSVTVEKSDVMINGPLVKLNS